MNNGSKRISISAKVSEIERQKIEALAAARGMELSAYMREVLIASGVTQRSLTDGAGLPELAANLADLWKRFNGLIEALEMTLEEQETSGKPTTWERFREICGEAKKICA